MAEIRFMAIIGEDRTIRPPDDVLMPDGEVEVTVRATAHTSPSDVLPSSEEEDIRSLRELLLGIAAEAEALDVSLPSDLAENHDHYAHGKPLR